MKRIIAIVTIVAMMSLMLAIFVFADDNAGLPQWFKDMVSWEKAQIDQENKDGTITNEQAKLYKDLVDQMEEFHTKNGFPNGMGIVGCGTNAYNNNYNSRYNGNSQGYVYGRGMTDIYRTR